MIRLPDHVVMFMADDSPRDCAQVFEDAKGGSG